MSPRDLLYTKVGSPSLINIPVSHKLTMRLDLMPEQNSLEQPPKLLVTNVCIDTVVNSVTFSCTETVGRRKF